jgi:hypothetical protein
VGSAASGISSTAKATTLTAGQLTGAALADGDLGGYQFSDMPGRSHGESTADPAQCQPIENMRIFSLDPAPKAFSPRLAVANSGAAQGVTTAILLAAFDLKEAEQILADLRTAVDACGTGYAGGALKFSAITKLPAPTVGDEAVAYQQNGLRTRPSWFTIVRSGSTVVMFNASSGRSAGGEVPNDLVAAQIAKVKKIAA